MLDILKHLEDRLRALPILLNKIKERVRLKRVVLEVYRDTSSY